VLLAPALVLGAWATAAAAATWTLDPVAVLSAGNGHLASISCPDTDACVAVGSTAKPAGNQITLVEVLANGSWTIVPSPNAESGSDSVLAAVDCRSVTSCVAVGHADLADGTRQPLIESWDGAAWTRVPAPGPSGAELRGVSCASASLCVAVGDVIRASDGEPRGALVDAWDGVMWTRSSVSASTHPQSWLNGVDCPTTTSCHAVGTQGDEQFNERHFVQLDESWDGTIWTLDDAIQASGVDDTEMGGVSCLGPNNCFAAGIALDQIGVGGAEIDRWQGSVWRPMKIADRPTDYYTVGLLDGISCASPTSCIAVGTDTRRELHSPNGLLPDVQAWDGTQWTNSRTPVAGDLVGAACTAQARCRAVGDDDTKPLAEHWDGTSWSRDATALRNGALSTTLYGVTCLAANQCTAVGTSEIGAGRYRTLVETKNGTGPWGRVPSPNVGGSSQYQQILHSVSCTSTEFCAAVGASGYQSLVEMWNGTSWTIAAAPSIVTLESVSCASATFCMTAGGFGLLRWDGTSWHKMLFAGGSNVQMSGISCTAADNCIAVSGDVMPVAQHWDGTSWTNLDVPDPGSGYGGLRKVSCTSATFCIAVGGFVYPLAEVWDGATWTATTVPDMFTAVNDVSCTSPTHCVLVGRGPVVESWDGSAWTKGIASPPPKTTAYGLATPELDGVACRGTTCRAVGSYQTNGARLALAETGS
jgi:hypothetical protein